MLQVLVDQNVLLQKYNLLIFTRRVSIVPLPLSLSTKPKYKPPAPLLIGRVNLSLLCSYKITNLSNPSFLISKKVFSAPCIASHLPSIGSNILLNKPEILLSPVDTKSK